MSSPTMFGSIHIMIIISFTCSMSITTMSGSINTTCQNYIPWSQPKVKVEVTQSYFTKTVLQLTQTEVIYYIFIYYKNLVPLQEN